MILSIFLIFDLTQHLDICQLGMLCKYLATLC